MAEKLLAEFPATSTAEWEAVIAKDLKGADYDKKLIWRTASGMAVKPYYRAEDIATLDWLQAAPGAFPYVRGTHADGGWRIRERFDIADPAEANSAARTAVAAGAEEITFGKVNVGNVSDLALLLSELDAVTVHLAAVDERLVRRLEQYLKKTQRKAITSTGFDPLGNIKLAVQLSLAAPPGFVPFTIDGARFEEAGASVAEQVGFTLAAGVDYLAAMQERGVDVAHAVANVQFTFATGGSFFFEIAKLRAFRMLWARVVESFGAPPECGRASIGTRTSRWTKTVYDPHVNVLRATTEAMAAILGGADSVSVAEFDECYSRPDEASRRLARNTQIMLKKEAMLGRVSDPGGGAYVLETFTDFVAREAWKHMQELEARGGYRKTAEVRAQAIAQSMAVREKSIAARRRIFVGTSQYANSAEKALTRIEPARFNAVRRATRPYEDLRLRTERHAAAGGKTPRLLLAQIGDAKMRAARATFAANFFACAGFEIVSRRFKTVDEIMTNDADVIVLCSSDPEYGALAAEILPKLKSAGRNTPVIVAGNTDNADELKAAGVAEFIHVRSNPLEVLAQWQQRLGIKE